MRYYVIGDEDTVLGFGMVGVEGFAASNPQEARQAFEAAIGGREPGIVIITERIAELIRGEVDRYLFSEQFPLIVEIPDRLGPVEGKPDLRTMVNQAIGVNL